MNPEDGGFEVGRMPFPKGFDGCWAGPNPIAPGFAYGSTDGHLGFMFHDGRPGTGRLVSDAGAAINGVARVGTWIGVSTRNDMSFIPIEKGPYSAGVPFGAHGITTIPSGYFVAPMGRNGIMVAHPPFTESADVMAHSAEEVGFYAYRLAILQSRAGVEIFACAGRTGGLYAGEFAGESKAISSARGTAKGLDIVDVYPLTRGEEPLAVAAVGRDGTLVLFRDILSGESVMRMYKSVRGVVYQLLSAHGDIYLFTSKGMYVLGELAGRFLRGELDDGVATRIRFVPLSVVAANMVDEKCLLVVTPGFVTMFDPEAIHQSIIERLDDASIQEDPTPISSSHLEWEDIKTTTMAIPSK